eukprot:621422-Pyramimonas_sp.AAC.1
MELLLCIWLRTLRQNVYYADPSSPTRPIIHGIRSGTRFARCMVYFSAHQITTAHPLVSTRIWLDDLSQRRAGSRASIRIQLYQGLLDKCH